MSAIRRNITPAAKLKSPKPMMSSAIQNATARLPITVKVFGNSMVSLIFPFPHLLIVGWWIRSFYVRWNL